MKKKLVLSSVLLGLFGIASFVSAQVVITNPLNAEDFPTLLLKIAEAIGVLVGSLGTIMIIVAGILYLTSAGSPERITTAKKALFYAIIGITISVLATGIVEIILGILKK